MPFIDIESLNEKEVFLGYHGRAIHTGTTTYMYWKADAGAAVPELWAECWVKEFPGCCAADGSSTWQRQNHRESIVPENQNPLGPKSGRACPRGGLTD